MDIATVLSLKMGQQTSRQIYSDLGSGIETRIQLRIQGKDIHSLAKYLGGLTVWNY
jgi:tRNA(His) 5'-end guanylyltransferase